MENQAAILQRLNSFLRQHGITQLQVARMLNTSQSLINAVLCGRRPLTDGMLLRLADAYGIDVRYLRTGRVLPEASASSEVTEVTDATIVSQRMEYGRLLDTIQMQQETINQMAEQVSHLINILSKMTDIK